jgi:hypothetical protein
MQTELTDGAEKDSTASNLNELVYHSRPGVYYKNGKLADLVFEPATKLGKRPLPDFLSLEAE